MRVDFHKFQVIATLDPNEAKFGIHSQVASRLQLVYEELFLEIFMISSSFTTLLMPTFVSQQLGIGVSA